jgi:O-methyltransferase
MGLLDSIRFSIDQGSLIQFMVDEIRRRFSNWKANPRRWSISYMVSSLGAIMRAHSSRKRELSANRKLKEEFLSPAIEVEHVELLFDPKFRHSIEQVKDFSCLDIARLANLWTLVQMAGTGIYMEVGSYRGGTALHICNAMRDRDAPFYCFDPFETGNYENIRDFEPMVKQMEFTDTQFDRVARLLSSKPNATVVRGFFPLAAEGLNLRDIAFCHIDVNVYEATKNCLDFLAPRLAPKSVVVLDDAGHNETPGVERAMSEFLVSHPSFLAIRMFPHQAVLLPLSHWLA